MKMASTADLVTDSVADLNGSSEGLVAGILSGVSDPGLTSQTTKYVSEDDIGKVQSLLLIVGVIGGTIGIQIYKAIWQQTDNSYPQAFFFLGIVVLIPIIVALIWKSIHEKNNLLTQAPGDENGTELQKQEHKQSPNT